MGLIDKFRGVMKVPADDEYDDYDEYEEYDDAEYEEEEYDEDRYEQPEKKRFSRGGRGDGNNGKVVNIHTTAQLQVVLVKPESFDSAREIADHLNSKRTVVVNLESAKRDVARRLVDFLSGVAYANDGQLKRVAASTFIITPYNVDVMGDLLDELENNGMFF